MFKKKILYKKPGSLLIELMLSLTLSSFVLLTLYKTYSIINQNIFFINKTSDLHIEKMQFLFHIHEDLIGLIIPRNINRLYLAASNLKKNKEKNKSEEEEKKYKKLFNSYSVYFPKIEKINNAINFSWVTTRDLLNSENKKVIRVEYSIEERSDKNNINNEKIYSIKRSESDILDSKTNKKYTLIGKIKNPIIYFIYPIIKIDKNEKTDNINNNNINSKYSEWKKNPQYEVFYEYKVDENNILEKPLVPYKIFIDGDLIQTSDGKSLPLEISLSIPVSDNSLENLFDFENKLDNNKDKNNDKNKPNLINPNNNLSSNSNNNLIQTPNINANPIVHNNVKIDNTNE